MMGRCSFGEMMRRMYLGGKPRKLQESGVQIDQILGQHGSIKRTKNQGRSIDNGEWRVIGAKAGSGES